MAIDRDDDVVWLHARREISIVELVESTRLSEAEVRELVDFGAITPSQATADWVFSADCLARVRAASRIRDDLELDTPAVALVLSFLQRIDALEARVRELNAQLQLPRR